MIQFFFYKFTVELLEHCDQWNLNSDWKMFKNIKIFSKLKQSQYADTFREELMIAMSLLRNTFAWGQLKKKKKAKKKQKNPK